MALKRKKKTDKRKLIERLDAVFSQYIRLRDASPRSGYCRCISCGKVVHWKEIQNGHLYSRKHMVSRFSEVNCSPQCVECNIFKHGNELEYYRAAVKRYGQEAIDILERQVKTQTKNWSEWELEEMIKYYKALVEKTREEKGL